MGSCNLGTSDLAMVPSAKLTTASTDLFPRPPRRQRLPREAGLSQWAREGAGGVPRYPCIRGQAPRSTGGGGLCEQCPVMPRDCS